MSGITVIGSTNIDLIMKLNRLPGRGETVTGGEFMQTFGGKGANQALALVEGKKPGQAVGFASADSAISVTRMGAQPSAPHRNESEELIGLNR